MTFAAQQHAAGTPAGTQALIATHSGLRGRPGIELTSELVERTVGGFAELLRRAGRPSVAVGRDERPGGEPLAAEVTDGLRARGVDVVDLGAVSTPGAKAAARLARLGGVAMVTGSHLEPELNGLKLAIAPGYGPVDVSRLPPPAPGGRRGGYRRDPTAATKHVDAICAAVDVDRIRASGIAAECRGGAGAAPELLLDRLGCGRSSGRSAIGLRLDADADRLQLVDESGAELDSELTLPLLVLALEATLVVKGADTSRLVDRVAADLGGRVETVPPGELHLVEAVARIRADVAGEGNGGAVVPQVGLARDGLATGAVILGLVARAQASLSELAGQLPTFARNRSTHPCPRRESAAGTLARAARALDAGGPDAEGALRIERAGGSWGLVRLSATEPVLRITAEAPAEADARALHDELRAAVTEAAGR